MRNTTANDAYTDDTALEPGWWQHPTTGRIISIWRSGQTGSTHRPIFTYSDDDGVTWAAPTLGPNWWQMYNNPAAVVEHTDDELVEVFYGSRTGSISGLRRVLATFDDAAALDFSGDEFLYTGASSKDFGYPAVARIGSKVYLVWYDGGAPDCDIWMAVGTRP